MKTVVEERKEILDKILNYISEYFIIDKNLIMVSKAEEYVNARYIIIRILSDYYSDREISQMTELTKSGVNNIKNKFKFRTDLFEFYNKLKITFNSYF